MTHILAKIYQETLSIYSLNWFSRIIYWNRKLIIKHFDFNTHGICINFVSQDRNFISFSDWKIIQKKRHEIVRLIKHSSEYNYYVWYYFLFPRYNLLLSVFTVKICLDIIRGGSSLILVGSTGKKVFKISDKWSYKLFVWCGIYLNISQWL